MALPLFVRKLTAPVEVKLVLSALSEEVRHLNSGSDRRSRGSAIATGIVTPKVIRDILDWSKEIKADIQKGKPPRVIAHDERGSGLLGLRKISYLARQALDARTSP